MNTTSSEQNVAGLRAPVNVLHVIDSLSPGGAERVLVELVNELKRRDLSVGVTVTRSDVRLAPELLPGVPVLTLGRERTWDWRAIRRFVSFCREQDVSVLHAHMRSSLNFCALAKVLSGNRLKVVFHDHYGDLAADRSAPLALRAVSRALLDGYVCVDPELQEWAIDRLAVDPRITHVLDNAIDLTRFDGSGANGRAQLGPFTQPVLAAAVANLRPQKNHCLLFEAVAASERLRESLHVLLVGHDRDDEYSRRCRERVRELNIGDNVTFLGSRVDVPEILRSVEVGLLSSRCESGPVTLLEYMAAGLPFVVTETGSLAQAVKNEGLPHFVAPDDVEGYTKALEEVVGLSKEQRSELGGRGRRLVSKFSIGNRAEQLLHIYEGMI